MSLCCGGAHAMPWAATQQVQAGSGLGGGVPSRGWLSPRSSASAATQGTAAGPAAWHPASSSCASTAASMSCEIGSSASAARNAGRAFKVCVSGTATTAGNRSRITVHDDRQELPGRWRYIIGCVTFIDTPTVLQPRRQRKGAHDMQAKHAATLEARDEVAYLARTAAARWRLRRLRRPAAAAEAPPGRCRWRRRRGRDAPTPSAVPPAEACTFTAHALLTYRPATV